MLQHRYRTRNPPDKNRGLIAKSANAFCKRSHWLGNRKVELEKLSKNPELAKRTRSLKTSKDISSFGQMSDEPTPIIVTKYDILIVIA